MESSKFTGRIPIEQGFYIQFSENGCAHHRGCDESQAVPKVEDWLRRNQAHKDHARVEMWLEQKNKQIGEDQQRQQIRAKRSEVDARVDRNINPNSFLKVHKGLIRRWVHKQEGIPEEED
jgi:uncharacterized protein YaiL (DUF2058 family)